MFSLKLYDNLTLQNRKLVRILQLEKTTLEDKSLNYPDFCKIDLSCHFDPFGYAQGRLWEKSFYAHY